MIDIVLFGIMILAGGIVSILAAGFFFIKVFSSSENTNSYFGMFFTGTMMALIASEMPELMPFFQNLENNSSYGIVLSAFMVIGFGAGVLLDKSLQETFLEYNWYARIGLAAFIILLLGSVSVGMGPGYG